MRRIIPLVMVLLLTIVVISKSFVFSEPEVIETISLEVESLLRRYGKQETIVLKLSNLTDHELHFPDSRYGMSLYKRQDNGLWSQVMVPIEAQSQIYYIESNEQVMLEMNSMDLAEGEYRVVFEGWHQQSFTDLVKGETTFQIHPGPTFSAKLTNPNFKNNDSLNIEVNNDRQETIIFKDSILSMKIYIKNESGRWMELPSPLYNDNTPFELQPGQSYSITVPPLKASGEYRIVFSGEEINGLELTAQLEFSTR